jgi:hypothetical protein
MYPSLSNPGTLTTRLLTKRQPFALNLSPPSTASLAPLVLNASRLDAARCGQRNSYSEAEVGTPISDSAIAAMQALPKLMLFPLRTSWIGATALLIHQSGSVAYPLR